MRKLILAILMIVPCVAWGETFGNEAHNYSHIFMSTNVCNVSDFVAPENGTVTKMSLYLASFVDSPYFKGVVFTDSSGEPLTLIAATPETDPPTAYGWVDCTFSESFEITSGTRYWVGCVSSAYNLSNYSGSCTGSHIKKTEINYETPTNWGTTLSTSNNYALSISVTYTPSGGGAPVTIIIPPQILIFDR